MMDIYYLSSKGEKLNLVKWPYRIQTSDVINYKKSCVYAITLHGKKIARFDTSLSEKGATLTVSARNMEAYYEALNYFFDVVEADVVNLTPGKLYVNGQYMQCYISGSKKTEWECGCNWLDNKITILSDNPTWIREETIIYERKSRPETGFLDYPYDYRYDYTPNLNSVFLENTEVAPCDIKMVIQGPCLNPEICIGENKYQVMTELSSYEYIVLNTSERTAYKVSYNGAISNVWGSLNSDYDNFKKVPGGKHIVTTNGNFKVQITAYISRSEPRWI